jgi:hypothetical protein
MPSEVEVAVVAVEEGISVDLAGMAHLVVVVDLAAFVDLAVAVDLVEVEDLAVLVEVRTVCKNKQKKNQSVAVFMYSITHECEYNFIYRFFCQNI